LSSTPLSGEKATAAGSCATDVSLRMKRESARVWSLPKPVILCTFLAASSLSDGVKRVRGILSMACRVAVFSSAILSWRRWVVGDFGGNGSCVLFCLFETVGVAN
jgi:hypothetical protein